ncbi:hypothetical protein KUTeg_003168, partial [Tegillarca granosa]
MQQNPEIIRLRGTVSHPCTFAPSELIFTEDHYLGATKVSNYLLSKKQGHTFLVLVNLRNDCVIEIDGATYSIRDSRYIQEPIIHPGIRRREIEEKEEILKKDIRSRKTVKDFDEIMKLISDHFMNESPKSNTACVFYCRTGKSRSTFALAVSGLGFPKGCHVGEEERVSCPNAQYTKGDFMIVQKLIRLLPNGQQIKREVDFVLDECFETMSPMHFHIREIKHAKDEHEKQLLKRQSLDFLERYLYFILFNCYLHHDKKIKWQRKFSEWMKEVAVHVGIYELLDNLAFYDFEKVPTSFRTMKERWKNRSQQIPFH